MLPDAAPLHSQTTMSGDSPIVGADPTSPRPPRIWPALLTLFFLAPLLGEVFSTSTTPLQVIFNPTRLFWTPALYGSGAILVRELVRRRGLGWPSLLTLGAAYGILEEALVTNTWFNQAANVGALGVYGRVWSVNLVWVLELTVFHAVISICVPIALVEAAFPQIATRPWLRPRGFALFIALITLVSLLGLLVWGFAPYGDKRYQHPPVPQYFIAAGLALLLLIVGLRLAHHPHHQSDAKAAPIPRRVYWRVLAAMFALMFVTYIFSGLKLPVPLTMGTMVALVAVMAVAVARWSRRVGWGARHGLALAAGALTFWLVFTPLIELAGGDAIDAAASLLIAGLLAIWVRQLFRRAALRDAPAP